MLHAKFQDHRISGSEEDLRVFFTIYGHGGHLGHVTRMNFRSMSIQGHVVYKFCSTCTAVPDASYQVSRQSKPILCGSIYSMKYIFI